MTLPDPPEVLQRLGLSWRYASPDDVKFIFASWLYSGMRPFILGPGCPWPHLAKVVHEARRTAEVHRLKWERNGDKEGFFRLPAEIDDTQHQLALKLLKRIYEVNQRLLIQAALSTMPTIVAYDVEVAEYPKGYIVGWAHPEYSYTRLLYRDTGLSAVLRAALDG